MIVLSPTGRLLGTTRAVAHLTDERLRVSAPNRHPSGDFGKVDTHYYRLCHVVADGNNPSSLSYLLPAVLLSPGDDPTLLPDWRPL